VPGPFHVKRPPPGTPLVFGRQIAGPEPTMPENAGWPLRMPLRPSRTSGGAGPQRAFHVKRSQAGGFAGAARRTTPPPSPSRIVGQHPKSSTDPGCFKAGRTSWKQAPSLSESYGCTARRHGACVAVCPRSLTDGAATGQRDAKNLTVEGRGCRIRLRCMVNCSVPTWHPFQPVVVDGTQTSHLFAAGCQCSPDDGRAAVRRRADTAATGILRAAGPTAAGQAVF
jgi:hypothetical protein